MISRRNTSHHSLASLVIAPDDHEILRKVRSLLDDYPRHGPPDNPSELCPYLYMGSLKNANNTSMLQSLGITHVLNCAGHSRVQLTNRNPYRHDSGIVGYLTIPADDHEEYDIMRHFEEAFAFLESCRESGGRALVHCNLGINRSGAISAAYLMAGEGLTLIQAITLLKRRRHYVLCNKGFRRQLIRFARARGYLDTLHSLTTQTSSVATTTFGLDRTNRLDTVQLSVENERKPNKRSVSSINVASDMKQKSKYCSRSNSAHTSLTPLVKHKEISATDTLQVPAIKQKRTRSPNRYHNDSLHRLGSLGNESKARSTSASYNDTSILMDTIHEDSRKMNGGPTDILRQEKDKKAAARSLSNFGNKSFMSFRRSKQTKSSDAMDTDSGTNSLERATVLSSTRPLRVYKRSVTDSTLYEKPPAHTYKRADTVATTDITSGMERLAVHNEDSLEGNDMELKLTQRHRSASKLSLSSGFFSKLKADMWKRSSRTSLNS